MTSSLLIFTIYEKSNKFQLLTFHAAHSNRPENSSRILLRFFYHFLSAGQRFPHSPPALNIIIANECLVPLGLPSGNCAQSHLLNGEEMVFFNNCLLDLHYCHSSGVSVATGQLLLYWIIWSLLLNKLVILNILMSYLLICNFQRKIFTRITSS